MVGCDGGSGGGGTGDGRELVETVGGEVLGGGGGEGGRCVLRGSLGGGKKRNLVGDEV